MSGNPLKKLEDVAKDVTGISALKRGVEGITGARDARRQAEAMEAESRRVQQEQEQADRAATRRRRGNLRAALTDRPDLFSVLGSSQSGGL
ncbi:MAG TPA: hypothetical protein VK966_07485 [Longimicrobiales bacterium]|nr:hypothetical protein [Longimicrobiales bacterium]